MTSTTPALPQPLTRDESGALLGQTMGLVALTVAAFAVGAYVGRGLAGGWAGAWFVASLASLLALSRAAERSQQLAVGLLTGFGALTGLALAPALGDYAGVDAQAVWAAGGATALFIAGIGCAGYATRRDLSVLSRSLFWALIALIVLGLAFAFVQIPGGGLVYAIGGLAIFAGLTLVDFQRLRRTRDIRTAPLLAASIFLDVVNVFTLFLPIFGGDE